MTDAILSVVLAVISVGAGLLAFGGAMTYEEKRRKADLDWAFTLLAITLALAFASGWLARGVS